MQTGSRSPGNYRWFICALLFLATTINYLDRQVIGLLKDTLAFEFNWSETDYSNIVMAFSTAYAIGYLGFGTLIDKVGTKLGYTVSVLVWSVAAMGHALATGTTGFMIARTGLGLGESGNFPASIKSVAEWFPKRERSFATGIFNSGTNAASIVGPLSIAWLYGEFGWKSTFLATGILGFAWLILWQLFYGLPARKAQPSEAAYINDDPAETGSGNRVSWRRILATRQAWAFITGKFLTDPIWWFYLFWVPSYFNTTYGLNLAKSAVHVSTVFVAAGIGSVLGGYLPGWLMKKGWPVSRARKTSMLIYAFLVVPVIGVRFAADPWTAVAFISLATAAHQAWSANIFTTVSDMFPKNAVSSVVGIGGMAGSVGGILFPLVVGVLLDHYKAMGNLTAGYNILFAVCSVAYLVAWSLIHWLAGRMERVSL